ncbi:MAG: SHOCT domain-containing protein [Sporichthyaceae bacterium]
MERPLLKFVGHVNGREAEISVHEDRVEWNAIPADTGADDELTGRRADRRARNEHGTLSLSAVSSVMVWRATAKSAVVGVTATDTALEFRVAHEAATGLADELNRGMLAHAASGAKPAIPGPRAAADDQIRTLGVLFAAGLLTDEEFEAERNDLLAEA